MANKDVKRELEQLMKGRTEEQKNALKYFYQYKGCIFGHLMTDQEYEQMVVKMINSTDWKKKALAKIAYLLKTSVIAHKDFKSVFCKVFQSINTSVVIPDNILNFSIYFQYKLFRIHILIIDIHHSIILFNASTREQK